jgi:hypothetical protein
MRFYIGLLMAGVVVANVQAQAPVETKAAAEPAEEPAEELVAAKPAAEPWRWSAAAVYSSCRDERDALQQRQNYDFDGDQDWEEGSADGDGWGVRVRAGKEQEGLVEFTFQQFNSTYTLDIPERTSRHEIETDRMDAELLWLQPTQTKPESHTRRGWLGGARYIGTSKDLTITERGKAVHEDGDIDWKLLEGGYFGDWRPYGWLINLQGRIAFVIGEVSGLSREGEDTSWDGVVREHYEDDDSWAYGLTFSIGLTVDFHERVGAVVGYTREWLYAFDATDSGTAMYPNNNDALFIENSELLTVGLIGRF